MALPINPHPIPVWRGTDLYPLEKYSHLPLQLREQLRVRYLRSQTTAYVSGPCYTSKGLVPDVEAGADRSDWSGRYIVGPRDNSISVPASYVRVLGPKVVHDDIETRCLYINDRVQRVNPTGGSAARRMEVGTIANIVFYGGGREPEMLIAWDGLCLLDNTRGDVETDWVRASTVKPLGYEWGHADVRYPDQLPQPFTPYGTLPSPFITAAGEASVIAGFERAEAARAATIVLSPTAPMVLSGYVSRNNGDEDEDEEEEEEEELCSDCENPVDDCDCCIECGQSPCECCSTCEQCPCDCCSNCERHREDCECCGNCGSDHCGYCSDCDNNECECDCSENSQFLHSYHSIERNVDLMLFGVTAPVFGIEMELLAQDSDDRDELLRQLSYAMALNEATGAGLIAEEDSSLPSGEGFELVGAPFTLDDYRNGATPWTSALNILDCDDDDRAGMHVNMDKERNFGCDDAHVSGYVYALNRMLALTIHVAGRESRQYASLDISMSRQAAASVCSGGSKYKGVHVSGDRVETRVMQGTTDYDTMMMRIEYCDALCSFSHPKHGRFAGGDPIAPHDLITMFYQHVVDRPGRWPQLDDELMAYDDARMKEMVALRDAQLPLPFDVPQQEATA